MLSHFILDLKSEERLHFNASSLFHGVLASKFSEVYAEKMHFSELKPYHQYLEFTPEYVKWHLFSLNDEAQQEIANALMNGDVSQITLEHKNLVLPVLSQSCQRENRYVREAYFEECPRKIKIAFVSPTAFKSDGSYLFYPSVRHIFQSLMRKFDAFNPDATIFSEELLADIEQNVQISAYRLRSTLFHLEGIRISAFLGDVTFYIKGPAQLVSTCTMLLRYGEYSGVGIKTAIGMGGMKIVPPNETKPLASANRDNA